MSCYEELNKGVELVVFGDDLTATNFPNSSPYNGLALPKTGLTRYEEACYSL